jgi:hypothetical protein
VAGLGRRELRPRAGQPGELARLRSSLNRQRWGDGERITENTLICVAGLWFTSPPYADEPGVEV